MRICKEKISYSLLLKEILLISLLVIILKHVGLVLLFGYFSIQIFMKRKDEWLLKSLFYFFIFRFLNPLLLPNSEILTILSWSILLIVLARLMFIANLNYLKGLNFFFAFIFTAFIASLFKSNYLAISLFKLLSFFLGFLAVFLSLLRTSSYPWEEFFISLWIILLMGSIPTLFIPSIGFAVNGTGFQGITNHPQFFGPFCALIGGIAIVLLGFKRIKPIKRSFFWILISLNFFAVLFSESRTALLLLVFLMLTGAIIFLRETKNLSTNFFPRFIIVSLSLGLAMLYSFSSVENQIINFLAKDRTGSTTNLTFERFAKSRSRLTDVSFKNFEENPMLGIGFAAPNHYYEFEVEYLTGTSIPISASMEKGVLIFMLLEEVGVVGFFSFCLFILSFFIPVLRRNPIYVVFILGPLILNLGEATFFSTNGQGIFLWSLFSLALIRSKHLKDYQKNESLYLAA